MRDEADHYKLPFILFDAHKLFFPLTGKSATAACVLLALVREEVWLRLDVCQVLRSID